MSNELVTVESNAAYALTSEEAAVLERVMLDGDLSQLTGPDRVNYYLGLCKSLHLNPMTRPFEYVTFDRKLVLYARKDCAEQLRRIHNVSIIDLRMEQAADLCIVTATARMPNGRTDIDTGIVDTTGLRGQMFANARLKCTTKAKRRVTLSICGLGIMDETEVETIPGARRIRVDEATGEILEPPAALPPAQMPSQRAQAPVQRVQAEPGDMTCSRPDCGKSLTKGQYDVSLRAFGKGLCPAHQKAAAGEAPAPPAPVMSPQSAEQRERWLRLKAEAKELDVNVEPFRPTADTAPADVAALLTGLETLLAEVRAGQQAPAEVAA